MSLTVDRVSFWASDIASLDASPAAESTQTSGISTTLTDTIQLSIQAYGYIISGASRGLLVEIETTNSESSKWDTVNYTAYELPVPSVSGVVSKTIPVAPDPEKIRIVVTNLDTENAIENVNVVAIKKRMIST